MRPGTEEGRVVGAVGRAIERDRAEACDIGPAVAYVFEGRQYDADVEERRDDPQSVKS
jgi:hypothetical protein